MTKRDFAFLLFGAYVAEIIILALMGGASVWAWLLVGLGATYQSFIVFGWCVGWGGKPQKCVDDASRIV